MRGRDVGKVRNGELTPWELKGTTINLANVSVNVEMTFHLECRLRFPREQYMLR